MKKIFLFLCCAIVGAVFCVLVRGINPIPTLTVRKEHQETWRHRITSAATEFSQKTYDFFDRIKETALYHFNRLMIRLYFPSSSATQE